MAKGERDSARAWKKTVSKLAAAMLAVRFEEDLPRIAVVPARRKARRATLEGHPSHSRCGAQSETADPRVQKVGADSLALEHGECAGRRPSGFQMSIRGATGKSAGVRPG